jgi:protein-S-isoprenylcysteine O-methyltransferase Ste14
MTGSTTLSKGLSVSAWIAYTVIVLEILFMISPFALYFYSVYAPPLRFLQGHRASAFLTQSVLPHFSHQDSVLVSVLVMISWPLIIFGVLLFFVAFAQIYSAKFGSAGHVSGGLYRFIRHPQYSALALAGLGCTIFWPRIIACLMYATMLFLYYFLATSEESRCLARFGEIYVQYLKRTGRFLPKWLGDRLPRIPPILPATPRARIAALMVLFIGYLGLTLAGVLAAREFAFSRLRAVCTDSTAIVSVAPLPMEVATEAVRITMTDPAVDQILKARDAEILLVYVIPREWTIPELGVNGVRPGEDMLQHPGAHGNPADFSQDSLTVFLAVPVFSTPGSRGKDILRHCLTWDPILEAHVHLKGKRVTAIVPRKDRGQWDGIPVPVV